MSSIDAARPSPTPNAETKEFWVAAARGELLFGDCRACGEKHYYPRSICPYCFSGEVDWPATCGRGTIYSFSVVRRGNPPYVSAYVTLEEGVSVFTNIVNCDPERLMIGQRVRLVFEVSHSGQPVAVFQPVDSC